MSDQNAITDSQSKNRRIRLVLFLRWLGGALLGYFVSFLLLILNETGSLPFLGLVISGQEELFELTFFYALYDKLGSTDSTYNVALFVYASLWGLVGALLMSGRRKQIRLGVIFLILYVITGCLSYIILAMVMIPT
jgi:hypothetical protein